MTASPSKNDRPKVQYRIPQGVLNDAVSAEIAKRAQSNKLPRRPWYGPDKLRAAHLAGQGKSGEEIAAIIGGTTGPRVRAMLRAHDISLLGNGRNDVILITWKKDDREAIEKAAYMRDRDPEELAALIVRKVLAGGDRAIDALVDELDVIG